MEYLVVFLMLVAGSGAELILTVTPEAVEPDFTPFFSLNCALMDFEEAKVVSMSISRQTTQRGVGQFVPREPVAEIRGLTPNAPRAARGFERLTVLGQITSFESELGTYLEVVWPNPKVEDLGLYTCDATVVGETGQLMPLTAQARVSTSDPASDRLLVALQDLNDRMDRFNETLQGMQSQLDNVTATTEEHEREREREREKEKVTEKEPTETEETTWEWDREPTQEEETAPDSTEESLNKLLSAVESIGSTLERLNSSLAKLEEKITDLEEEQNETDTEGDLVDRINTYFIYGNSSYFLFEADGHTDSYRAETVCESKRLYLAEIGDEAEFLAVVEETIPYVRNDQMVLVAGRKKAGTQNWLFQGSGQQVEFFAWGPGQPVDTRNSECLALRRVESEMDMVALPCTSDQQNFLFLCEESEE